MAHSSHGHSHGYNHGPPMVGHGLTRGQFAKIIFPSALSLILFIAYSILVHIYAFSLDTKELPIDAILFCIFWTLLISSFLRGAFTSPGLVEREWYKRYPTMYATLKEKYKVYKQQIEQQQKWMNRFQKEEDKKIENEDDQDNETTKLLIKEEEKDEIKDDDDDNITFPDNFARPPRSHYCYELGSNVLRMDHFCVWFNNAVGFYNYKYFLLTIIYLLISCLLSIYILIYRILIKYYIENFQFGILNTICLLLTLIICIFFTVFAAMHSFMHLWQLSKNLTSIEYHKYVQIKSMATHFNISFPNTHEFDHGIFENCKKMLGYDLWFWCFPFAPSLSEDGYLFKYNQENKRKIEHVTKSIQSARQQLWKKSNLIK